MNDKITKLKYGDEAIRFQSNEDIVYNIYILDDDCVLEIWSVNDGEESEKALNDFLTYMY